MKKLIIAIVSLILSQQILAQAGPPVFQFNNNAGYNVLVIVSGCSVGRSESKAPPLNLAACDWPSQNTFLVELVIPAQDKPTYKCFNWKPAGSGSTTSFSYKAQNSFTYKNGTITPTQCAS